jgi:hypothetical protein
MVSQQSSRARRDEAASEPMDFPHANRILPALGVTMRLTGVLDRSGCIRRGTPAFTDGTVTHFASESPSIHVAAHEAAHQLQHVGVTYDLGLGPEGHACAVADAVARGGSASPLVSKLGRQVPSATRNYVDTDGTGAWKNVSAGAKFARLSETGEAFVRGKQVAYAAPQLIAQASAILNAKKSGIKIAPAPDSITVDAPDGSGTKTLSQIGFKFDIDPTAKTFYGDCRQAAREIMGPKDADTSGTEEALCREGGGATKIGTLYPEDLAALVVFVDRRIRETQDYGAMTPAQQQEIQEKARKDFAELPPDEKERIKKTRISDEKAKELGINRAAEPAVGEAFASYRPNKPGMDEFRYHYAAVIMITGGDRVTLENEGAKQDTLTENWKVQMYGPASKQQTFYDERQLSAATKDWPTIVVSTHPPAPPDVADLAPLPTRDLLARLKASTDPSEQHYLMLELTRRTINVSIHVYDKSSTFMDDHVTVMLGTYKTATVQIPKGQSRSFQIPAHLLGPVLDPLHIQVVEGILIDTEIGSVDWPAPYNPETWALASTDFSYSMHVSM